MKRIIHTDSAPKAVGPYSQAVEANGMLFISGQIPIDPATGKLVEGGIREQTEQVLKNIGVILKAAGYEYQDVVKSTCLLNDMDNFAAMQIDLPAERHGQFRGHERGLRQVLPGERPGPRGLRSGAASFGRPGGDRNDRGEIVIGARVRCI